MGASDSMIETKEHKKANDSYIAMFRGMLALAWADGVLEEEERTVLMRYIDKNQYLSEEAKKTLRASIDQPVHMNNVWDDITDPHHRAHVINVSSTVFHADEELETSESELHRFMMETHMSSIDAEKIEQDVRQYAMELRTRREAKERERQERLSPMARLLEYIDDWL
ncbi:MAG: DUF533 domain-containing protein [Sphaerospermopsis sp. SIO1G2]|nr:DUF533 domain-containing protein [Sphaerospermopsis sp. SIO1G2]